jgi:hypothetical protein
MGFNSGFKGLTDISVEPAVPIFRVIMEVADFPGTV